MLFSLMLTAFLMGVGGIPHCSAMCGAACVAVLRRPVPPLVLLGRGLGYAALGAAAVLSVSTLKQWSEQVAMLRPLWTMAQVAALALGAYLLFKGRMPVAIEQWGHELYRRLEARLRKQGGTDRDRTNGTKGSAGFAWARPVLGGMAWAALPCGLLYGAVLVAAQANTPLEGVFVMLAFALPSGLGVWFTPWILSRLGGRGGTPALADATPSPVIWLTRPEAPSMAPSAAPAHEPPPVRTGGMSWVNPAWALRLAGAMLIFMSLWAVRHRLWEQWLIWCA